VRRVERDAGVVRVLQPVGGGGGARGGPGVAADAGGEGGVPGGQAGGAAPAGRPAVRVVVGGAARRLLRGARHPVLAAGARGHQLPAAHPHGGVVQRHALPRHRRGEQRTPSFSSSAAAPLPRPVPFRSLAFIINLHRVQHCAACIAIHSRSIAHGGGGGGGGGGEVVGGWPAAAAGRGNPPGGGSGSPLAAGRKTET
jgi:hypothetical protein